MEREKNYIQIENRDFHNMLNEVREEVRTEAEATQPTSTFQRILNA